MIMPATTRMPTPSATMLCQASSSSTSRDWAAWLTSTPHRLNVYYHYTTQVADTATVNGTTKTVYRDSVFNGVTVFWGTEEVLQSTTISNDRSTLEHLAADLLCTYLKTPAGIFTEPHPPHRRNHQGTRAIQHTVSKGGHATYQQHDQQRILIRRTQESAHDSS